MHLVYESESQHILSMSRNDFKVYDAAILQVFQSHVLRRAPVVDAPWNPSRLIHASAPGMENHVS